MRIFQWSWVWPTSCTATWCGVVNQRVRLSAQAKVQTSTRAELTSRHNVRYVQLGTLDCSGANAAAHYKKEIGFEPRFVPNLITLGSNHLVGICEMKFLEVYLFDCTRFCSSLDLYRQARLLVCLFAV